MIGITAAVVLGGVLLKGISKMAAERGFSYGMKQGIRRLYDKNREKDTKLSKLLNSIVGVSNEELATMMDAKIEDVKTAIRTEKGIYDETTQGLVEMIRHIEEMMGKYNDLEDRDKEFIQSFRNVIDSDELANQIVETIKEEDGAGVPLDTITLEINNLFSNMGWDEKFQELQMNLEQMEEKLLMLRNKTEDIADGVSTIKNQMEDGNLGEKKVDIVDSVLTRSNVINTSGNVVNISGSGKYIGEGAVNIEGETVNYTNIKAESLSKEDWKDILSNVISDIGIGDDLEKDISRGINSDFISYSDISRKFNEVDALYDDLNVDADILIKMGNALYYTGNFKKSYECYMTALRENRKVAAENIVYLFSDKNIRKKLCRDIAKIRDTVFSIQNELYQNNDLKNHRRIKDILKEIDHFKDRLLYTAEGVLHTKERKGTIGGISENQYERLVSFYDELFHRTDSIQNIANSLYDELLSENYTDFNESFNIIKKELLQIRNIYNDRMNIIKEV